MRAKKAAEEEAAKERGVSWGMEDDDEPQQQSDAAALALRTGKMSSLEGHNSSLPPVADPKKALRAYFDREGEQMEPEIDEVHRK